MQATFFDLKINSLVLLRLKDIDLSNLSDQELLDKYNETYQQFLDLASQKPLNEVKVVKGVY